MELTLWLPIPEWRDVILFGVGVVSGFALTGTLACIALGPHPFGRRWR